MIEPTVNDTTCNHCASTITRAVKEVDASGKCEIDLAARRVRISSTHPASEFLAAIQEAGYTPAPAA
jgi:copper chaperone